jgi:hypothetical protein
MRKDSQKLIQYIYERIDDGADVVSTSRTTNTPKKAVSSAPPRERNKNILIDPKLMGKEFGAGIGKEEVATALSYTTIPYKTFAAVGGLGGGLLTAAKQVLNAPKRAEQEVKAQQEAIRNMTGVENYYKNLGIKPIPMHQKGESSLDTLKSLLGLPVSKKK